ncbi:hypothetical protein CAL7716_064540 [Calothrix sp. PCC 7716]|nr:hypothetical protein CAL7716_064540 [Calothrix sp. PCC 7716]
MPSPFPGMNPYLEAADLWSGLHGRLIITIADILSLLLRPNYFVAVEERIYEEIKERYLEVKRVETKEVVTTIEILSPKNKRAGEGRTNYETKRQRILSSNTHLVEIDLLRCGVPLHIMETSIKSHYRILVSRSERRPQADLYAFDIQNPIPGFLLPLRTGDVEPMLDLQNILNELYDRASYDLVIDYHQEPIPGLSKIDFDWLDTLLRAQGLR